MASEDNADVQSINGQVEPRFTSSAGEEVKLVSDAFRTLPPYAVKDLLSIGKVLSLQRDVLDDSPRAKEDPSSQPSSEEPLLEPILCGICLGILQFAYCDDKEMLVKKDCANDFALLITKVVKQEGHQVDNFSLEVSIPSRVMENEQAVW
ncbi:tRNA pseudouridine(55) synthase [Sarracenia purpurea var. burkii]